LNTDIAEFKTNTKSGSVRKSERKDKIETVTVTGVIITGLILLHFRYTMIGFRDGKLILQYKY
jgi:hypothetical protein